MVNLFELSAKEISEKIRNLELEATDYISSVIQRVKEVESKVHAFVTVLEEDALERAKEIDRKARRGEKLGSLCGVAVAIKDNICTKGVRTTCSSRMLKNFIPPYNATVIERLLKEDAIIIGKTNMDEFAMGSTTETSFFGATRNPWNLSYVPGGSSGGSAAAVSTRMAPIALGSDTGGSIRCPASYCNIIGLKPTYGLVSRYGLIAYANSLEQIGSLAFNTYDCALLLDVISGYDPRDSTSIKIHSESYAVCIEEDIEDLRIGVPREFFGEGVDPRVKERVWKAIKSLEDLGASYKEISLPTLEYALAAYYIIAMSEASSNLARYDGLRYGFSVDDERLDWSSF
ncbi:TPA: Asp-tRNA(Asn)/Glu-tRNA(Gln) amidotransferase subunit GatA, partial [Candidatus Bathyarchaeota archaeon]|nr:Asp-tRNA(Asn)/Glu-tRNA(Gln) amidotransferase subunit GatA [Candidatus Bathyarchaeota archaeon]